MRVTKTQLRKMIMEALDFPGVGQPGHPGEVTNLDDKLRRQGRRHPMSPPVESEPDPEELAGMLVGDPGYNYEGVAKELEAEFGMSYEEASRVIDTVMSGIQTYRDDS